MKTGKKILISVICAALVIAGIIGYKIYNDSKIVVSVTPVSYMMGGYYEDPLTTSGMVYDMENQIVDVDYQKIVNQVFVEEGQEVKEGDPLVEYDITSLELSLELKKLSIESLQNDIDNRFKRNSLDVKDINYKENHLYKRKTNPLEPNYRYDWQMTEINEDRKVNNINFNKLDNHPKVLYPYINKKNFNLNTLDIPGSQSDTKSHLSKLELKYGKKLKYIKDDIIGSHPGSLIKGIKTNRNTNPLDPSYPLFNGELYEYEKESKEIKSRYDYKSLLDYYNKYSKINLRDKNEDKNKMKIKNEMNIEINKIKKNKNYLEGFGKNNKYYPREKFKSSKNKYVA